MKSFLQTVLGAYIPVTYQVISADGSVSEVIPDGLAGVDWLYFFSGLCFLIALYSVFRLLGKLIGGING